MTNTPNMDRTRLRLARPTRLASLGGGLAVLLCSIGLSAPVSERSLPLPFAFRPAEPSLSTQAVPVQTSDESKVQRVSHAEPLSSGLSGLRVGGNRQRPGSTAGATDTAHPTVRPRKSSQLLGLGKVVASLSVVLGVLFGLVWVTRRFSSVRSRAIPEEVVQVLGQFSLGGRQQACVVRFGSKLLALSITPTGVETLGELSDLKEVENLTQLCMSHDIRAVPGQLRDAVDRYAAAQTS